MHDEPAGALCPKVAAGSKASSHSFRPMAECVRALKPGHCQGRAGTWLITPRIKGLAIRGRQRPHSSLGNLTSSEFAMKTTLETKAA